jgi:hypothetical protein
MNRQLAAKIHRFSVADFCRKTLQMDRPGLFTDRGFLNRETLFVEVCDGY